MKKFNYGQLDEFTAYSLQKIEKDINKHRASIGKSIYSIGKLKGKTGLDIVYTGMKEIGMEKNDLQEALICTFLFLEVGDKE